MNTIGECLLTVCFLYVFESFLEFCIEVTSSTIIKKMGIAV